MEHVSQPVKLSPEGEHLVIQGWENEPTVVRQYNYLRLRYQHLGFIRIAMVGLAIAFAILLIAVASIFLHTSPALPITLIIVGVIIGVLSSWEMGRKQ